MNREKIGSAKWQIVFILFFVFIFLLNGEIIIVIKKIY